MTLEPSQYARLMKPQAEWTWVHYKVLELSFDCLNLPELLVEHEYRGFPGGATHIPATTRRETEDALLDLLAAGALDVFDDNGRISPPLAVETVRADSSWTYEGRGAQVEVVENAQSGTFQKARPTALNPHAPD